MSTERSEFEICSQTGQLSTVDLKSYPDGMPLIAVPAPDNGVARALLRPNSLGSFFAAMFWFDAFAARGGNMPVLILPNVPGARQDRLNDTGDYLFTVRSVAQAINARNFPCVILVDPHSDVASALIDRSRVISAADCVTPPPGKYAAVVSPDGGAEKRAGAVARKLGVPLLHAWKTREVTTGKITGFGMQEPPHDSQRGDLVLVVDDICDGGGTFIGLADQLDLWGLKAHLWTTHGLYTQGTEKLLDRYGHLYCTDSIVGPRERVIEINVCDKLLKGAP